MDLNGMHKNNHFGCRELGHFQKDCSNPKGKVNVCMLASELSPKEQNELLAALMTKEEEQPMDTDTEADFQ